MLSHSDNLNRLRSVCREKLAVKPFATYKTSLVEHTYSVLGTYARTLKWLDNFSIRLAQYSSLLKLTKLTNKYQQILRENAIWLFPHKGFMKYFLDHDDKLKQLFKTFRYLLCKSIIFSKIKICATDIKNFLRQVFGDCQHNPHTHPCTHAPTHTPMLAHKYPTPYYIFFHSRCQTSKWFSRLPVVRFSFAFSYFHLGAFINGKWSLRKAIDISYDVRYCDKFNKFL